ncbi:MAG: hypothetical protein ACON49_08040 [Candidatus Puniceispirillaceae bacterium]
MSKDDNKQVQEALQAIKKLVEVSENQLDSAQDVLTLDQVVWRNPVTDEAEDAGLTEQSSAPSKAALSVSERDLRGAAMRLDKADAPVTMKTIIKAGPANTELPQSQSDDLSQSPNSGKEQATPPQQVSAASPPETPKAPVTSPLQASKGDYIKASVSEQTVQESRQKASQTLANVSSDIQELTAPLGRRGGGFYSRPVTDTPAMPVIQTTVTPQEPKAQQATASNLAERQKADNAPAPSSPRAPVHAPVLDDFAGSDFNFSAAEGLMTAASFDHLQGNRPPIQPDIDVPIASPPVDDPVQEIQQFYADQDADDNDVTPVGQPNLHIVSDQTLADDETEEEGFSGAVRLALRAIIKEQVSSWLQGNMTGLIEEALTTPQKRPGAKNNPSSKKR